MASSTAVRQARRGPRPPPPRTPPPRPARHDLRVRIKDLMIGNMAFRKVLPPKGREKAAWTRWTSGLLKHQTDAASTWRQSKECRLKSHRYRGHPKADCVTHRARGRRARRGAPCPLRGLRLQKRRPRRIQLLPSRRRRPAGRCRPAADQQKVSSAIRSAFGKPPLRIACSGRCARPLSNIIQS